MPVILTGLDVTALTVTVSGSNTWIAEIKCASGEMAQRTNTGAYVDDIEVSPAEAIWLNFNDSGGANPLDFVDGDTLTLTMDAVVYTIFLDATSLIANTPYYLDDNGTPFTDAALTTPAFGSALEQVIELEELNQEDAEFSTSEGIGATEQVAEDSETTLTEIVNTSEQSANDDEMEVHEISKATESFTTLLGDASGSTFTKTVPGAETSRNWTKKDGQV